MPRGGARNGMPGKSYGQRTDLGVAKLPTVAAPGQTYGAAGAQIQAQQQMPMAPQPVPQGQAQPAVQGLQPGGLGPLSAPTSRPDEPVTHGAQGGLGPGTEVLPQAGVQQQFQTARDLITNLAQTGNSPALTTLAAYANTSL